MKAKSKKSQPTDAQLKSAYAMWKAGGISIWGIKRKTHILAKVLLPAFEKQSGKKIKSPAAKMPEPASATKQGKEGASNAPNRQTA